VREREREREREGGEREISNFCSDGTCKKSLIQL